MEHKQILNHIVQLEEKYPVTGWKMYDLHVWPFVRVYAAFQLYGILKSKTIQNKEQAEYKPSSILSRKWAEFKEKIHNRKIRRQLYAPADVVFLSSPACRANINGKWFNKYFDEEITGLKEEGFKALFLEFAYDLSYLQPVYHPESYVPMDAFFEKHTWGQPKQSQAEPTLDRYREFYQELKDKFHEVDFPLLEPERLRSVMKRLQVMKEFFVDMLKNNGARIVFLTNYYEQRCMALCAACYELGITVIDMQHGLQQEHVSYERWSKVPEAGFEMLPAIFWSWNRQDAAIVNEWARQSKYHSVVNGGNPWLDLWKSGKGGFVAAYDMKVKAMMEENDQSVNILFTAQPIEEAFPEELFRAIKTSPPGWNWWIRLHPRQHQNVGEVKALFRATGGSVFIEEPTLLPLPCLLGQTNVHVTNWSSVVIEAENFAVPSVVLHQNGADIYQQQISTGKVIFADGARYNLLDSIRHLIVRNETPRMDEKRTDCFGILMNDHFEKYKLRNKHV